MLSELKPMIQENLPSDKSFEIPDYPLRSHDMTLHYHINKAKTTFIFGHSGNVPRNHRNSMLATIIEPKKGSKNLFQSLELSPTWELARDKVNV
jgi:hypothetical protein